MGSGKTEFLKGVEKQTPKKIIYLDLWNIKDNRTVINIAFHKLSLLKVWLVNAIIVFCLIISILMSNVINLGIASRFGIDNSSGILQMAGVIALFVAVFQLLKIQLDSIFVWLLQRKKKWGKILVVDDFDRVSSEKQEEAYKLFNILNGKLPIIFVGNYSKLTKNEDNYLQKIIDRQIELPYSLHSQSIWEKYFCEIQKKFNVKVNSDLVKIFTNEKRNLREQYHFNDYVNLELIERGKSKHVQIDQQLFIIYLYLFHKNYYQKILEGWSPKQKQSEEFENEVEKNIFTILKDNSNLNYSYLFVRTSIYPVLIPFTTLIIVHPLGEVKKIQKEHTL